MQGRPRSVPSAPLPPCPPALFKMEILLALDYGGTKLSAALCERGAREWLARETIFLPRDKNARTEQAALLALARKMLVGKNPAAIGVSFGGPVDAERGIVLLSHHVAGWENIFLRDQLSAELRAPVVMDNDANVAAFGEYKFGAGSSTPPRRGFAQNATESARVSSMLYITVSTGVGGGWVIDGKIFRGADGVAGEIGHTLADPQGARCICGRRGCVEAMACGPAIARDARAELIAHPRAGARLRALIANDLNAVTAERVARAANDGDDLAQNILDAAARALGFGIGAAITLMNPARVVIGGGVAKAGERYFQVVTASAVANTLPQMRVDIVPAALGDDAPLWGAVALAEEMLANENEHLPLRAVQG